MTNRVSESLTGDLTVDSPEFLDPPADPIKLLVSRIERAVHLGVREPLALAFSTADEAAQPSSRIMVVSEVSGRGLIFTTHASSRKGRELAINPRAAALLYWRETSEQIAIRGKVERLQESVANQKWAARPVFTHPMSVASSQSAPLADVEQLRARARGLSQLVPLKRPESYAAYELVIEEIEFWANGTDRLHERLVYTRSESEWKVSRLQP
jgi:dihydrophenazinedicarboxylate synthase